MAEKQISKHTQAIQTNWRTLTGLAEVLENGHCGRRGKQPDM